MASEKITALIEEVKALTVLELSELVKALEEEFGVSAAAMAAPAAGAGAAAEAAEEKAGKMPCGSFCGSSFFLPCSLVSERSFSGCRYPARTLCRRNDPDRIRRKERRPSSEYCVYAVCRGVSLGRIS